MSGRDLALQRVPGLGAHDYRPSGRINPRTALGPVLMRYWEGERAADHGITMAREALAAARPRSMLMAAMCPHPANRELMLAQISPQFVDRLGYAARWASRTPNFEATSNGLEYLHLLTRHTLGPTSSVAEARRKARACLLELHPDRGRTNVSTQAAVNARQVLMSSCATILRSLDRPEVGPYMVGTVAFTPRQALSVGFLALSQRTGRLVAGILVAAALAGTIAGTASALQNSLLARAIALNLVSFWVGHLLARAGYRLPRIF